MSRKHFLMLVITVLVLGIAGGLIMWLDQSAWKRSDIRVGQKLLPGLKLVDVAQVVMRDGNNEVQLIKSGDEWQVKERADFPVDLGRLSAMLNKTIDVRILQADPLPAAQRAGFTLMEPGERGKPAVTGAGTTLELKDKAGKSLARMLLGKVITKRVSESPEPGQPPREIDKPVGRHLLPGGDDKTMVVASEALEQADASPDAWLIKEILHVDRTRSITVTGPDGALRYNVSRLEEGGWWNFGATGERPDQQKAQDSVSPLYAVNLVDVVANPGNVQTGLDKPVVAKAETFDNLTYTLKIGARVEGRKLGDKPGENLYYVSFTINGDPPKERIPGKGESAEDKARKAKEYAEYRVKLLEQIAREKRYEKWTYLMPARPIEPLLRSRAEMLQDKKPVKK